MATFSFFSLKKSFVVLALSYFKSPQCENSPKHQKNKMLAVPPPPRPSPFFYPISKWLNFAEPKITVRVEPRENDGEEDEA
jgi:hypothetical protein